MSSETASESRSRLFGWALSIQISFGVALFIILLAQIVQHPNSGIVQQATRQSELVNREIAYAQAMILTSDAGALDNLRKKALQTADDLAHTQTVLSSGVKPFNYENWPPHSIRTIDREAPARLDDRTRAFAQAAHDFANAAPSALNRFNPNFATMLKAREPLEALYDRVAYLYVVEADKRLGAPIIGGGIVLMLFIGALFLERPLIFHPMEREIRNQHEQLRSDYERMENVNEVLQESQAHLSLLVSQLPAFIYTVDKRLKFSTAKGAGLVALGLREDEVTRSTVYDFFGSDAHHVIATHEAAILGVSGQFEHQAFGRRYSTHVQPLRNATGAIVGAVGVALDLTDHERDRVALQRSQDNLALAQQTAHLGSWDQNLVTEECYWSDEFYRIVGLEPGAVEASEQAMWQQFHPDDLGTAKRAIYESRMSGEAFNYDLRIVRHDGDVRWINDQGQFLYERDGRPLRCAGTRLDITSRKNAEERLAYQAHYDVLTGLPNRSLLHDRLEQALVHAHRTSSLTAILFVDLDRFKNINDTLGHARGDMLLQLAAARIKEALRETDTVARSGGDEFVVVMSDVRKMQDVARLAQVITDAFARPFAIETNSLYCTVSIGISMYPTDGSDASELLRNADTAMYKAKESGRNSFQFYTGAMYVEALDRLELETDLRRALERDEFMLHYQPIVNPDGRIVSVEALLRWDHPTKGLVGPDQFIPLAEETGLIVPIGEWVLRTGCTQLRRWQQGEFPDLRLAVNLSARQFLDPHLRERITNAIDSTGIDASSLEIEITESVVMKDVESATKTLNDLKTLGVQISIDDFGTGYSSLAYLKRFPIDTLKIDRTFVRDISLDRDDRAIVKAVISLARSLSLKVIAEGVETQPQLALLVGFDCDHMQGYYFSKPLDVAGIGSLLSQSKKDEKVTRLGTKSA